MGEWIKRGYNCIKFLPREGQHSKGFKQGSHISQGWPQKRYIVKLFHSSKSLPKIISSACITQSTGPTGKILGFVTHNVQSNLITQDIGTKIKQDPTFSLVFNVHHKRLIR